MGIKTAHDLFVSQLRDIYSAEKQAIRAYPKIAKAVRSEELKDALEQHLEQTKGQVERLDRIFEVLDKKPSGGKRKAVKCLVEEARESWKELSKGPLLDAAIIAAGQHMEHYEMASYGTVAAFAEATGETEIHALLAATLQQERDADERLSEIAQELNAKVMVKRAPDAEERAVPEGVPRRGRVQKKSAGKKAARGRKTR